VHGVVWCSIARCKIALSSADVARCGWRHGGGVRRRGSSFAVKGLEESLQVVALGVDKVRSLSARERGRNEAAGLGEIVHLSVASCGCCCTILPSTEKMSVDPAAATFERAEGMLKRFNKEAE
jgi:hypothetical protein